MEVSVLIVEDSFYSADLNIREIKKADMIVRRHQIVSSERTMMNALKGCNWDLIISDNSMPNFSALKALEIRNREHKNIPFIIVSEDIHERDIEKAFEEGCSAFVPKEALPKLRKVVRNVLCSNGCK